MSKPFPEPKDSSDSETPSLLHGMRSWIRGVLRPVRDEDDELRETLEELIDEGDETPDGAQGKEFLSNIVHFREMTAEDVMVPRADIIAIDSHCSLRDFINLANECGHSRIPVYQGSLDKVIGMIHIRDLLHCWGQNDDIRIEHLVREVLFISPSMRANDLLLKMRQTHTHLALVVDEYGGIDGLVTIENLVEQIVGEIDDEHDDDENTPVLLWKDSHTLIADARVDLQEFEEEVGTFLTEEEREENDTLGGLIFSITGRVPSRGENIQHSSGFVFEILDADPRRIKKICLRNIQNRFDDSE